MVPVALSDMIAVGEVPTAEQLVILAGAGFRSLLNTQPDGEVARLPSSAELAALAAKAGMTYRHIPIVSRHPPAAAVDAFDEAMRKLPGPIYACCYSGARTAAAWALAAARHEDPSAVVEAGAKAGFDMSFVKPYLSARAAEAKAPAPAPAAAPTATPASAQAPAQASAMPVSATAAAAILEPADPHKSNGSSARSANIEAATSPAPSVPPSAAVPAPAVPESVRILLPRAASAGGYAVSG